MSLLKDLGLLHALNNQGNSEEEMLGLAIYALEDERERKEEEESDNFFEDDEDDDLDDDFDDDFEEDE